MEAKKLKSGEEFQGDDLHSLTLLKQIWGIWTVLTVFPALYGILLIFMGIINLSTFLLSPTQHLGMGIYAYTAVIMGVIGVGLWVLFLGNIYIKAGLERLDFLRWKLLVIEAGIIGIVLGVALLNQILAIGLGRSNLYEIGTMNVLIALVGTGVCLALLYLAFTVRDKFREE